MAIYLIKVSIIWLVVLAVYQLLLNETGMFKANRIFLLTGVFLGLVLPLISVPFSALQSVEISSNITTITNQISERILPAKNNADNILPTPKPNWDWTNVLLLIYIIGVAVLLFRYIKEAVFIIRHAIYGTYTKLNGFKIFRSNYAHPPFSFMGWIFIGVQSNYTEQEMNFILHHENAHNLQKHWLDIILIHLACVLVWFHPLVWVFRHKIKMQHEFEADIIAADNNAYNYGHFLLEQTLLKDNKNLVHLFNYSPIKNRITMLTKQNSRQAWRYLAIVPVLCFTTLLMAQDTSFTDDKDGVVSKTTTTFEWSNGTEFVTVAIDPETMEEVQITVIESPTIIRMNTDTVIDNKNITDKPATFRKDNLNFQEYFQQEFDEKNIPDSIYSITIDEVVVDKRGKIVRYKINYRCGRAIYHYHKTLDNIIRKIMDESGNWTPAVFKKKKVNVYIDNIASVGNSKERNKARIEKLKKEGNVIYDTIQVERYKKMKNE